MNQCLVPYLNNLALWRVGRRHWRNPIDGLRRRLLDAVQGSVGVAI